MKPTIFTIVTLSLLVTACGSSEQAAASLHPTGVHLQAVYEIPKTLEGQPSLHEQMAYLVWFPEGYGQDPDKKWPLIYFLHGSGAAEYDSTFVMSFGLPEVLLVGDEPEDFPFVVISPQAFSSIAWWEGQTPQVLNALLADVIERYQIDDRRVYLTGLSMGGYGSWFQARDYPDTFAAMISISGSGFRTSLPPGPEELCAMGNLPVWIIHGQLDQISAPSAAEYYAQGYERFCDAELVFTLYPDVGHLGAYQRAYRDPALYAWLLGHELAPVEPSLSE